MKFELHPDFEGFREARSRRDGRRWVVPVWVEVVADSETPISAFAKLGTEGPSFLLESAEINDLVGRHSFVGRGGRVVFRARGGRVMVRRGGEEREFEAERTPFEELERLMAEYPAERRWELPGCWGGAVGYLGYDAVRWFEPTVGEPPPDDRGLPDMVFVVPEVVVIFDHKGRRMRVVAAALPEDGSDEGAYEGTRRRIQRVLEELSRPVALPPLSPGMGTGAGAGSMAVGGQEPRSNTPRERFLEMVREAQEHIRAGDIFQIVLSQRFEAEFGGDALELYRALRFINPSPYMFCVRVEPGLALVGSSPEVHARLTGRLAEIRPIAGTRRRGRDQAEDEALARELLEDHKERAEHLMLVDLARNDLGRICEPGSVRVSDFMTIERYSHVMHIVSHVSGELAGGRNGFDLMRATFPAGTVSGAPKVRAMQLINGFEVARRGVYAGAVGYFRFDGDADSCIALRTVVLKDGVAYAQAGAGVVMDSTPEGEWEETANKARAALRAVSLARGLAEPPRV